MLLKISINTLPQLEGIQQISNIFKVLFVY